MTGAQRVRSLEESLGGHRKKLRWISGSVGVQKRRNSGLIGSAQRRELGSHDFAPRQLLLARCQFWHSIGCVIFVVELMSKFVKDNVLPVGRVSSAGFGGLPGKNQRAHPGHLQKADEKTEHCARSSASSLLEKAEPVAAAGVSASANRTSSQNLGAPSDSAYRNCFARAKDRHIKSLVRGGSEGA